MSLTLNLNSRLFYQQNGFLWEQQGNHNLGRAGCMFMFNKQRRGVLFYEKEEVGRARLD